MDLIPGPLRREVLEAVGAYTLGQINALFEPEGFSLPPEFTPTAGSMRRSAARAYDESINYTSLERVSAYLRVVERLIDELTETALRVDTRWGSDRLTRIRLELSRADITIEPDGRLRLARRPISGKALANAPSSSGIKLAMTMLERMDVEPEQTVGAAKELVEATIKFALTELDEAYVPSDDLPALAKHLHRRLRLDPKAIAPTTRGADTIIRILGGLTAVPHGLAELRNAGYGTGHGQVSRIAGLKPRHAELAARAATAYAGFILDTLADPEAPWR